MKEAVMVTTSDNPYDPFIDYDSWYMFDLSKGYRTCERLASITIWSDQLSESENIESVSNSIDQMIKLGAISNDGSFVEYKKVYKSKKSEESDNEEQ